MTSRKLILGAASLMVLVGGGLAACGKIGPLDQPAPLFGEANKREYYAQRAERAQAQARQNGDAQQNATGSAEREANTEANSEDDNAPLTTRDIRDPSSQLNSPRDTPVPGEPNPLGPTVSTQPPN
jgi:hypothetical protein